MARSKEHYFSEPATYLALEFTREPTWNFNKYLVSADGKVVLHFDSEVAPESARLTAAIE